MKLRDRYQDKEFTLNITPLIDIVFLLLIFFMVSTNFNKITNINLSLPEVDKEYNSSQSTNTINITISKNGDYFINDLPLVNNNRKTLISAITNQSRINNNSNNKNIPFVISGDSGAPYQSVVTALDAAGELGFTNIKIAALKD